MDSNRWQRIQDLFHGAADLPPGAQQDFLKAQCGDDESLVADVKGLLQEDARGASLLDRDLAQVARQILDDGQPCSFPFEELGQYTVRGVLGEGGMGVVYLAERQDLGRFVALKLLRDAWLSPARRERFAAEQRTLAQLNHPSIGRLYDSNSLADGTPFFVMEYVEGAPITDYCAQHQCSVDERLQLFRMVCEAVDYAHGHAIIHRDLKPSNILVKTDGSIRLLDFGIAKQVESLDLPSQQTMTGLRLMTPAYASPEQIRGQRLGVQTDVYSLGVILFELLAGQLPFDLSGLSSSEAETILVEHEPPKPSTIAAKKVSGRGISASTAAWTDLDVLCLTAIHKDPEHRYRSVEALIRDIDHYLKGEPLEARPDKVGYRAAKFVKRNRRAVAVGVLISAVIVGMALFFTLRLARARDAAVAEAARTQRIQTFMMNLFQGGDETLGPSDDMKVITLVDRGAQQAHALDADPKVQAELYATLGSIYEAMGKLDQAQTLFQSALELRKSAFGAESPEVAESLISLGGLNDDQAQYAEAERLDRQAIALTKKILPRKHPLIAKAMYALGTTLVNRGQYDPAIEVLNEAAQLQSENGSPPIDLDSTLTELANAHFYRGDYAISDALNQRVLGIDRKLYGNKNPNVGEDLINLGVLQMQWGHYPEAERYEREALEIMQSFYGKDHPETASVMVILSRALIPQGRLDEAATLLRQALPTQERVYGKVHPRVAGALSELGKIALQQGRLDEAEADFRRMADIYREVYSGKHYYIGNALASLSGVCMERKQYGEAERFLREALQMYAQTLPPEHQMVGVARIRLGRALLRERRYAEAETESSAGYAILTKQSSAPSNWLQDARSDLAEEYDALRQPEKASQYRAAISTQVVKAAEIGRKE